MDIQSDQIAICKYYGSDFVRTLPLQTLGISRTFCKQNPPIHGLRHPAEGATAGWYIWTGDWSSDPNFFVPIHAQHLVERCPSILHLLGLAPGWRFLVADNYEDVWFDPKLIEI